MGLKDIRAAIQAAVRGINGEAGGYTHDFSARPQHQVQGGRHDVPPAGTLPFACVFLNLVEEDIITQGKREQRGTWILRAWCKGHIRDVDARMDAAEDLLDDLRAALRADPTLGGTVMRFTVAAVPFDKVEGGQAQNRDLGTVYLAITPTWRESYR